MSLLDLLACNLSCKCVFHVGIISEVCIKFPIYWHPQISTISLHPERHSLCVGITPQKQLDLVDFFCNAMWHQQRCVVCCIVTSSPPQIKAATRIPFQSCTILNVCFANHWAVFWCLITFKHIKPSLQLDCIDHL